MPQLAPCPDQLQLDFKPREISLMTVEQFKALSPEERNALTFEEMNEVFNRDAWCKWGMKPGNGAKMYEEYLEWITPTPAEIQNRLNNRIPVSCTFEHQNFDSLKRQLSEGADPNYRAEWYNDGSPTLHQWALHAHVEAVQLLLDHGADINILDNLGRSALEYATGALNWSKTSKDEQVVKLIIQAGADVNVKSTLGNTPLIWAARAGNLKITKLLLDKGANVQDTDNARNLSTKHDSTVKQNRQSNHPPPAQTRCNKSRELKAEWK